MKSNQLSNNDYQNEYLSALANKIHNGFEIIENNEKLPFAVLSKKGVKVNNRLNLVIFIATFGLWTLPWIYITQVSSKEKKILIAIDENGRTFEEKCYS